jgi:WD repeat-containing protein 48
LRYLFANLVDEEIKRDSTFREKLIANLASRANPPSNIQLPDSNLNGWRDATSGPTSGSTIRAPNGFHLPVMTPGLHIGQATPGIAPPSAGKGSHHNHLLTPTTEEGSQLEKTTTQRSSTQDQSDYFSRTPTTNGNGNGNGNGNKKENSSTEGSEENIPQSPAEDTQTHKKSKGLFGKKFGMSLNMKKFATSSEKPEAPKPAAADEKSEDSDSHSTKTDEKVIEDNFFGALQKIRQTYEEQANVGTQKLETQIAPSLPNETPVLKPPVNTTILIQEDRPDSGGVADLFEGKVGSLAQQADLIEKCAPVWLADVLLRVRFAPPFSLRNSC